MKVFFGFGLLFFMSSASSNIWKYQVNIDGHKGTAKKINSSKASFDAGPYYCEVSKINEENHSEYRSLTCAVGPGTVSTGALCTKKSSKFPSVQYAILNLNGPKTLVNVVVSCEFDKAL